MSMLSGQADRLRKMAEWDGVDAVIASELRDAADTITELRDDLQRANAENAKLRELAFGMYGLLEMFDKILGNHDACETPRPLVFGEDKSFKDVMRELGVEVD